MTALRFLTTLLILSFVTPVTVLHAQEGLEISGRVTDRTSGLPVSGVRLTIEGTEASAVTGDEGTYRMENVPLGEWTIRADHPTYGSHVHPLVASVTGAVIVDILIDATGIALEAKPAPPAVEAPENQVNVRRRGTVVEGTRLRDGVATSNTLGDLIQRTIPALRRREIEDLAGNELCLEFRGVGARSMRGTSITGCNSPSVYFDGSLVQDPNVLYGMSDLSDLTVLQAMSPGETSAQYGNASYGVLLVETTLYSLRPPLLRGDNSPTRGLGRKTFDWTRDPQGHSFGKTLAGAFVGNAVGLAAGLAVGRQCIFVDENNNLDRTCSHAGVAGAGFAAVALPALGAALGTRWAGRTEASQGSFGPALLGAGFGLLPGYIFSLSTVGSGVETTNLAGQVFLVVATPLFTTFADRLYRKLRGGS